MKIHLNVPVKFVCILCVLNITIVAIVRNFDITYGSSTVMGTHTCRNYESNNNSKFCCNSC